MKHILTLSLSLSIAFATQAQLAPRTEAPLYRHMLEVNAQWAKVDPALASDAQPVHFANEAERIAQHLHLVAGYLRAHSPEGLSADAATKRTTLLNDLDRYADRGLFPQNHVLPYRNPVFIDPVGTACAVGQLMIESGHRDLAESISKEMNLAYVHDMKRADVLHWATQEGFTEDELAWIQPAYPPAVQWTSFGGGTNGPVKVMLNLSNSSVLVAGEFSEAGGVPVQNVALFQGPGFTALGSGVQGTITCGAVLGDEIYLGGHNINGINDLAHWDGTQWWFSTVFLGKMPKIFALQVLNDTLYAAGETMGFVGADEYVMRMTGPMWQPVPGNFNAPIRCLGTHDGKLVAGGEFTGVEVGDPVFQADHVAVLGNNSWSQLGNGLNGTVRTFLNVGGSLYAGGAIYDAIDPLFGLAWIGAGASTWTPMMPSLPQIQLPNEAPIYIDAMATDGTDIVIGGLFDLSVVGVYGNNLAKVLGPDMFLPMAVFNAPVNAVLYRTAVLDPVLIAGGSFSQNNGQEMPYVAETALSTGIPEQDHFLGFALYPNPVEKLLNVEFDNRVPLRGSMEVVDVQGRTVLTCAYDQRSVALDVSPLAKGTYTVRLTGERASRSQTFIKH